MIIFWICNLKVKGMDVKNSFCSGGSFHHIDHSLSHLRQTAESFRLRLGVSLFYSSFQIVCCVAFFTVGAFILLGRYLFREWSFQLSLGLAIIALVAAVLIAAARSMKRLPKIHKLMIWLDSNNASGGLAATAMEIDMGRWHQEIRPAQVPRFHTVGKYGVLPLWASVVFVAGVLLCPVNHYEARQKSLLHIEEEVAEIQQKLDVIEEEQLIPPQEMAEIRKTFADLRENNDAGNAGRTYELLETLARRMDSVGEEAAGNLRQSLETASMLAPALESLAALPEGQQFEAISPELAEVMKKLTENNPKLAEMLKQAAADGINLDKLDPETLKKLADCMKNMSAEMRDKLCKLADAKLAKLRPCSSGNCKNPGECKTPGLCDAEGADLAGWLAENGPEAENLLAFLCAMPGQGGVSRGRGDAPLYMTNDTRDDGGARRNLQVASDPDLSQSTVLAKFGGAPGKDEDAQAAQAGRLQGGDAAVEQRQTSIRPEHRAAVEKYFKTK